MLETATVAVSDPTFRAVVLAVITLPAGLLILRWCRTRLITFRAVALTPLISRRLSFWLRAQHYVGDAFFDADGAGEPWIAARRAALSRLAGTLRSQSSRTREWSGRIREGLSDLRFTDANRVPFRFAPLMREHFDLSTVVTASDGPRLRDLDGRWSLDASGSYGVNVAGYTRYKEWMQRALERVKDVGPVLGPLHPVVDDNLARLKQISQLDEVSFHMSGTEAVMAAVRLARFNTRRKLIVCFAGAYHGWWDGVVPGLGSERRIDDCLTLKDLDPASLAVIRLRRHEIAAVLVNPVQSFHPNSPPPNDAVLLTSSVRATEESTLAYRRWLRQLRDVCTTAEVPLIFDEVYTGFRLAPGGAQEFFDVRADMVVYGKTLGGGLPVGVVCGRRELMRRFDPEHPMRLSYVVGTFSAHPYVMAAMNEFLCWVTDPATRPLYEAMNARCATWVGQTNARLSASDLPVRIMALGTVWTVLFREPGRYNWLLQYYLRAHGISLSWVGTGRCLASMDFSEADYQTLGDALLASARQMKDDGWWLNATQLPERDTRMKVRLMQEIAGSLVRVPQPLRAFYADVMQRKDDDHHASHNDKANQHLHLLSSSVFIYCYFLIFSDLTVAMCLGLASLFVRQFGHAVLEPPCHKEEETLLGYNTRNKTLIVVGYVLIALVPMLRATAWSMDAVVNGLPAVALQWFFWTVFVVGARVGYLIWRFDFRTSMVWYVKLVTDPLTDVYTYFPRPSRRSA
jgi:glutamate-1-semialdehyde 2,1-aminomutase